MDSTHCEETAAWCALLRAPGVGCQTLNPLLTAGASATELLHHPPGELPAALRDYLQAPDWTGAERDVHWLQQPRNHLLRIIGDSEEIHIFGADRAFPDQGILKPVDQTFPETAAEQDNRYAL